MLQEKVIEVKNSLNCKMNYIDYVHVCNTFLVSNNKNISKVKETQDKKLCNLLLKNIGKNSDTCQDPDKVIFNFSSYNLNNHEKPVLCKGLNFTIPSKAIEYSEFYYLLKGYLEKLPAWISVILIRNVSKVDFEIAYTHHLSKFPGYLTKLFPEKRLKH